MNCKEVFLPAAFHPRCYTLFATVSQNCHREFVNVAAATSRSGGREFLADSSVHSVCFSTIFEEIKKTTRCDHRKQARHVHLLRMQFATDRYYLKDTTMQL